MLTRTGSKMKSIYDQNQNAQGTSCTDVTVPMLRKKDVELDIGSPRDRFQSFLTDEKNSSEIMQKVHRCSENGSVSPDNEDATVCSTVETGFIKSSEKCNLPSAILRDPACWSNRESFVSVECNSDVPMIQMNGWSTPPTECKHGVCKTLIGKGSKCTVGASVHSVVVKKKKNVFQPKEFVKGRKQTASFKCGPNKSDDLSLGEQNSIECLEGNIYCFEEFGPLRHSKASRGSSSCDQSVSICKTSSNLQHVGKQKPSLASCLSNHEQVNELEEDAVQYKVDSAVLSCCVKEHKTGATSSEVGKVSQHFSCQRTVEFTGKRVWPAFSCARTLKLCQVLGSSKKESATPAPSFGSELCNLKAENVCTDNSASEHREDVEMLSTSGECLHECSEDAYSCVSASEQGGRRFVPVTMEEKCHNSSEVHHCKSTSVHGEPEEVLVCCASEELSNESIADGYASGIESTGSREVHHALLHDSVMESESTDSFVSSVKHAGHEDENMSPQHSQSSGGAASCNLTSEHSGNNSSDDFDKASEHTGDEKICSSSGNNSDSTTGMRFVPTSEFGANAEECSLPVKCSTSISEYANSVAVEDNRSVAINSILGKLTCNETSESASSTVSAFDQRKKEELPLKSLHAADKDICRDVITVSCYPGISELVDVSAGNKNNPVSPSGLCCNAGLTVCNHNEMVNMDRILEISPTSFVEEHCVAEDRSVDEQNHILSTPECAALKVERSTSLMRCDSQFINILKFPGRAKEMPDLKFPFCEKRYLSCNLKNMNNNTKNILFEQFENILVPRKCKEVARKKKSCTLSFSELEVCNNRVNKMEDALSVELDICECPEEVCLNSTTRQVSDRAVTENTASEVTPLPEVTDSKPQLATKHVSVCISQECKPSKKVIHSKLASHIFEKKKQKKTARNGGSTQILDIDKAYEEDILLLDVIQDDPELFGSHGNWNSVITTSEERSEICGDNPIPVSEVEENRMDNSKDLPVSLPAALQENERDDPLLCHGEHFKMKSSSRPLIPEIGNEDSFFAEPLLYDEDRTQCIQKNMYNTFGSHDVTKDPQTAFHHPGLSGYPFRPGKNVPVPSCASQPVFPGVFCTQQIPDLRSVGTLPLSIMDVQIPKMNGFMQPNIGGENAAFYQCVDQTPLPFGYCKFYFNTFRGCVKSHCWFEHVPKRGDEKLCMEVIRKFVNSRCQNLVIRAVNIFDAFYKNGLPGSNFSMQVLNDLLSALIMMNCLNHFFEVLNLSLKINLLPDLDILLNAFHRVSSTGVKHMVASLIEILCKCVEMGMVLHFEHCEYIIKHLKQMHASREEVDVIEALKTRYHSGYFTRLPVQKQ